MFLLLDRSINLSIVNDISSGSFGLKYNAASSATSDNVDVLPHKTGQF